MYASFNCTQHAWFDVSPKRTTFTLMESVLQASKTSHSSFLIMSFHLKHIHTMISLHINVVADWCLDFIIMDNVHQ